VEAVASHRPYFTSEVAEKVLQGFLRLNAMSDAHAAPGRLTGREREIVQLLAESKSNKEVATILNISLATVQTHRAAIMHKLGINSVVDLVHYAIRNRLIAS